MQTLWLENGCKFQVIPNQGAGSCLFRSINQALNASEENHFKIRSAVVSYILKNTKLRRRLSKAGFFGYWLARYVMAFSAERSHQKKDMLSEAVLKFYKEKMGSHDEPGTTFELLAAADLYQFHVDFVSPLEEGTFGVRSCRQRGCQVNPRRPRLYFLSSRGHGGHWELLQPISPEPELLLVHEKLHGWIYCCEEERSEIFLKGTLSTPECSCICRGDDDPDWPVNFAENFQGCGNTYLLIQSDTRRRNRCLMTCCSKIFSNLARCLTRCGAALKD